MSGVFSNTSKRFGRRCARNTRPPCWVCSATREPDRRAPATRRTRPNGRIAGLTPTQLRTPEAPGKWSIAQVLRHLADSEVVWGWRMRLILAQDRPADHRLRPGSLGRAAALRRRRCRRFAGRRCGAAARQPRLIERATPEDLQRVGVHAERGEESAGYLMRLFAGHDLMHLNQIDRIKKAVSVDPSLLATRRWPRVAPS